MSFPTIAHHSLFNFLLLKNYYNWFPRSKKENLFINLNLTENIAFVFWASQKAVALAKFIFFKQN